MPTKITPTLSTSLGKLQDIRNTLQNLVDYYDPSEPYEVATKTQFKFLENVLNDLLACTKKLKKSSVEVKDTINSSTLHSANAIMAASEKYDAHSAYLDQAKGTIDDPNR